MGCRTWPPTTTYAGFSGRPTITARLRRTARGTAIAALSLGRRINGDTGWIRFPYYHHVFDDERAGFERQLNYMSGFGEFVSLDDALSMLEGGATIDGRYFCLSFDDGLASCRTGALPALAERGVKWTVYLVSDLVGCSLAPDDPIAREVFGFTGLDTTLDFLSWDDCRAMVENGVTFGSHSTTHARLATLNDAEAVREITGSKATIEREMGRPCTHFCPPFGIPDRDFNRRRDPALARTAGYRSFVTGQRGPTLQYADPFDIRRDHLLAGWGTYQLRYFLSLR